LPVRLNLALALLALMEELVKLFLEFQECGLLPVLLGLLLVLRVVHCLPPVSPAPRAQRLGPPRIQRDNMSLCRVCPRAHPGGN
jgi:hypothetical protein